MVFRKAMLEVMISLILSYDNVDIVLCCKPVLFPHKHSAWVRVRVRVRVRVSIRLGPIEGN